MLTLRKKIFLFSYFLHSFNFIFHIRVEIRCLKILIIILDFSLLFVAVRNIHVEWLLIERKIRKIEFAQTEGLIYRVDAIPFMRVIL